MAKRNLLKIVNGLLALAFIFTALGGITRFFVPALMPYEAFKAVHPIFGLTLVVLAVTHIVLNFGWIKSTYFKNK